MTVSPPLNAVRAFEAVARTGAFTTAGAELGVTSAAVSQQVRNLEAFWQKNLFIRQGNRLVLSEAGLAAYPAAAQAMNTLSDLSETMRDSRILPSLVLSAPHSVVQTWLPDKLVALKSGITTGSNIRLHIRPDEDPVGFAKDGIHMRIFYGHELYRDYRVDTLFHDHVTAIASPEFVERHGTSVNDINERHLIHTLWGPNYASFPSWANCLSSSRAIDIAAGLSLTTNSAAISFARKGLGIGLVPSRMAMEEISNGQLVRMQSPEPLMPHPYCLAYPHALQGRRDVQQVAAALLDSSA